MKVKYRYLSCSSFCNDPVPSDISFLRGRQHCTTSFSSSLEDSMRTFTQYKVADTECLSRIPGHKDSRMMMMIRDVHPGSRIFYPFRIQGSTDPGFGWVEPQTYSFRDNIDAVLARARLHWCRAQISGQFAPLPCSGSLWTRHPRRVAWNTNRSYALQ